jgi:hypothetical protein
MASNTRETWRRRLARRAKAGRKRKNQDARHSTPSASKLFAGFGDPGQAAPNPTPAAKAPRAPARGPAKAAARVAAAKPAARSAQ